MFITEVLIDDGNFFLEGNDLKILDYKCHEKIPAKMILTIVGFMYKKIGLSKYKVKPPNNEITIPPIRGT